MLTVSGIAKSTESQKTYNKGSTHGFTLFSKDENLDDILGDIETFMNGHHWDDIVIVEAQNIDHVEDLSHKVLRQGANKALDEGMSLVIHNKPVEEAGAA